jgi:hypothetical protein
VLPAADQGLRHLLDHAALVVGAATTAAGAVLAVAEGVDTGVVIGAAGLLVFLFRSFWSETKRKDAGVWDIVDEYRVERDYYRDLAEHWQARWLHLVQPEAYPEPGPAPDMAAMKAAAQQEKEQHGRRRK